MGTIKKGILGGFSGKVGTVVGASWKGVSYMRGRAISIHNPQTTKQQRQRHKMAWAMQFLKNVETYVNAGWNGQKMTPMNAAISHAMKNAITMNGDTPTVNWEKLIITKGNLPAPWITSSSYEAEEGVVYVNFFTNNQGGTAVPSLLVCEKDSFTWHKLALEDSTTTVAMDGAGFVVPASLQGKTLEMFLYAEDKENGILFDCGFAGEVEIDAAD